MRIIVNYCWSLWIVADHCFSQSTCTGSSRTSRRRRRRQRSQCPGHAMGAVTTASWRHRDHEESKRWRVHSANIGKRQYSAVDPLTTRDVLLSKVVHRKTTSYIHCWHYQICQGSGLVDTQHSLKSTSSLHCDNARLCVNLNSTLSDIAWRGNVEQSVRSAAAASDRLWVAHVLRRCVRRYNSMPAASALCRPALRCDSAKLPRSRL